MALNIIDFSNGIRPEEIQDNFEYLQAQISRERASVGGSGVASGLEIKININENVFEIEVSDGTIIDDNGDEIFIAGKTVKIDPPELYQYKETLNLSKDRTVRLKYTPYALNRRVPVEHADSFEPQVSGIIIKHKNSLYEDDYIRVRSITDRELTVTGALSNELDVSYYYTAKRIDTLYLNDKLEICIKEGTTSTTPSSIMPLDAKYLIAYLEIDNEYTTDNDIIPHAYIYIKDDLRSIRNLYTDDEGTLFICGVPFDDLQIIHLKEPKNPKPNTLWLNMADNTLYCWRSTDEFIYKNKIEITTDFIEQENADLVFSTYMDFVLGGEELDIYLNDALLVKDIDYEEISHDLPTYMGNEGSEMRGNTFRILQTINRSDEYDDALIEGDVITYLIKYKDSQYMWIPINKMNYLSVKNTKAFSTYYDGIKPEYIYEKDEQTEKAYFDSSIADSLGVDEISGYPYKYQYFFFHREKDLNMLFTPYRKELSVMVNQMFLHEDQFEEITIFDIYQKKLPAPVLEAAAKTFGWTSEYINDKFNEKFDSSGIGFKLVEPLDSGINADNIGSDYRSMYGSNDLFVEAITERRICATPVNRKLERSATFVYEDSFKVEEGFDGIIDIGDAIYRYNEHQLEVYIDGLKLVEGKDYIEEYGYFKQGEDKDGQLGSNTVIISPIYDQIDYLDQDYFYRKKAAVCNIFKILRTVTSGSVIEYRITTNVYSYDHINNILDEIGDLLESCEEITSSAMQRMSKVEDTMVSLESRVTTLEHQEKVEDPRYLTTDSVLGISNMYPDMVSNAIKSLEHINISITLKAGQTTYSLNDINGMGESIWAEDYINIFYHSNILNTNSYWVPGLHYNIREISNDKQKICYLEIKSTDYFKGEDILYISGIKLSNNRKWGGLDE